MDRKGIAIIVACVVFMFIGQYYLKSTTSPVTGEPGENQRTGDTAVQQPVKTETALSRTTPEKTAPEGSGSPSLTPEPATTAHAAEFSAADKSRPVREIILHSGVLRLSLSSVGAYLKEVRLKEFTDEENESFALIRPLDEAALPMALEFEHAGADLRTANYHVSDVEGNFVRFTLDTPGGLRVEKTFRLTPGKYDFTFALRFTNTSEEPLDFTPVLRGPGSIVREDDVQNYVTGAVRYSKNTKEEYVSTKPHKDWEVESTTSSDVALIYIGVRNRFFGCAMLPAQPLLVGRLHTHGIEGLAGLARTATDPGNPTKKEKELAGSMSTVISMRPVSLEPGATEEFIFTVFAGPQRADVLAEYGPLTELLDYGIFRSITRIMLVILRLLYSVTGNYGVSIIFMTILVKMALFPLSRKGAISQAKQQQLAPQLKELQAQYKNNKQRLQQETMKMYKEEGVHPLGGCLPMILQLPVFIGLLRLLQYSIELRQAVFIPGWINDLSKPDTIASLPDWIPLLGGRLNILPIIMGAVSILHQRMMPKPADPKAQQQMAMMKFMPVMFVFLLYNWPAGLLLYWTMSSALSIVEQHLLKKSKNIAGK